MITEQRRAQNKEAGRRFRLRNPGYTNKYIDIRRRYYENNREKVYARHAVYRAVKSGKITKPRECESCSTVGQLEADHADYSRRLDVTWLCKPCHVELTERRKQDVL